MTKINQLFTRIVDREVAERLVKCLGLEGMDDSRSFTRYDLERVGAVTKVYAMVDELIKFYLPCKAKVYLTQLTEKKVITVVKQVIRLHNYSITAKEKNNGNKKIIVYRIMNNAVIYKQTIMHKINSVREVDFG